LGNSSNSNGSPAENKCPICESEHVSTFLHRNQIPVHQNLVCMTDADAVSVPRGDLTLVVCHTCGFIYNSTFDSTKMHYNSGYDNAQLFSPRFQEHVTALVDWLVTERNVRHNLIVEIGCGKGEFLRALIDTAGTNNKGIGIDPGYAGPLSILDGRLRFEKRYFDAVYPPIKGEIVVCRHVIEHISAPIQLLELIHPIVADYPSARLFFETPTVEAILRGNVWWDFFYEHCSYFTQESLTTAFMQAGFHVNSVQHVFGGQYLWLEASTPHSPVKATLNPAQVPVLANAFAVDQEENIETWLLLLKKLASVHKIALWGAGAKGVTFANMLDPQREYLSCVVDANPAKQRTFLVGTGHPIVSPDDLVEHEITCALVLNPNYFDEIQTLLKEKHIEIDLINMEERQFIR
jgi:hypothetical protein